MNQTCLAIRLGLLTLGFFSILFAKPTKQAEAPDTVSYAKDIWPIVQQRCQGCHQPALKQGELDLTHYEGFRAGGKSGPAFLPGHSDQSLVISVLTGQRQPRMPFGMPPLTDQEIDLFRRWIESGAEDDTPSEARTTVSTEPPVYHLPPVLTALAYSPDGRYLAVSGYREVLLHGADGSGIEARLVGRSDRIQSLAFSADGGTLMAAGGTPARFGEVQLWDVASGSLRTSVTSCHDTLFGASLSPDASKIAFGCADQSLRVIDAANGQEQLKMGHHENWVLGTVFGIDGERIVSVGRDQAAKLSDASTGEFIENINLLRGELTAIARHPTREAVVIGGEDRVPYYYLMDRPRKMVIADDSTLIRSFERQEGEIFALAFSPDGMKIAVAGAGNTVPIYSAETGKRMTTCRAEQGNYALAFHPSGEHLALGGFDGRVRVYTVDSGELLNEFIPVPIEGQTLSSR